MEYVSQTLEFLRAMTPFIIDVLAQPDGTGPGSERWWNTLAVAQIRDTSKTDARSDHAKVSSAPALGHANDWQTPRKTRKPRNAQAWTTQTQHDCEDCRG
jgi:hypothetical protein